MKHLLISIGLLITALTFTSCHNPKKAAASAQTAERKEMEITGEIVKIENGKDGYMATVNDKNNKSYFVTISLVNMQKSGGTFKRFETGQKIKAKGTFWNDDAGNTYITAKNVEAVP